MAETTISRVLVAGAAALALSSCERGLKIDITGSSKAPDFSRKEEGGVNQYDAHRENPDRWAVINLSAKRTLRRTAKKANAYQAIVLSAASPQSSQAYALRTVSFEGGGQVGLKQTAGAEKVQFAEWSRRLLVAQVSRLASRRSRFRSTAQGG